MLDRPLLVCLAAVLASFSLVAQSVEITGPLAYSPGELGGDVREARFTPDGSRLLYLADEATPGEIELYSVLADGSAPATRLSPAGASEFRITPDGTRVAFRDVAGLLSAPVDGSLSAVRIATGPVGPFELTPDSSSLVWVMGSNASDLFLRPLDASTSATLLYPTGNPFTDRIKSLALTADGTRAVLVVQQCSVGCLPQRFAVVALSGTPPPLELITDDTSSFAVDFALTPDSSRVVYRSGGLHSTLLDGSAAVVPLTPTPPVGGSVREFRVAPGSDRVVYLADQEEAGRFELYSVPCDGSAAPTRLNGSLVTNGDVAGSTAPTTLGAFQITPDGQRVVYRADQRTNEVFELFSVAIEGGTASLRSGAMVAGGDVFEFQVAPDSIGVLFRADQVVDGVEELFAAPFAGGLLRLNPPLPASGRVVQFQISVDTQHVVYRARQEDVARSDLYHVGILGGTTTLLGASKPWDNSWPAVSTWSLSPDASRIAYVLDTETVDQHELFGVPIQGGVAPQRLSGELTIGPPSGDVVDGWKLSPNGGTVVYAADGEQEGVTELYRVSTTGGGFARLSAALPPGGSVATVFAFTADGTRVVYLAEQDQAGKLELYSVRSDGFQPPVKLNHLLPGGRDVSSWPFELSPDGQHVVYLAAAGGGLSDLHVTRVDGTGVPLRLSAPGQSAEPVNARPEFRVSPDGAWVVYRSGLELFSVPIDGSRPPARLNRALAAGGSVGGVETFLPSFQIAPNSRFVAYLADAAVDGRHELYLTAIDGYRLPVRLNVPPAVGGDVLEFAFSPTGAHVVYYADEALDERFELFSVAVFDAWRSASFGGARPWRQRLNAPLPPLASVGAGCCGGDTFSISEDANKVAYTVRFGPASEDVFLVPVDGSAAPTQLTFGNTGVSSTSIPGYSHVFFIANGPAGSGLFAAPLDASTAPVHLTSHRIAGFSGTDELPYRVSPDGAWVAYRADDDVPERFDLYARPTDASALALRLTAPFTEGNVAGAPLLQFTPDSARVVYSADHAESDALRLYSSALP
jgi:Tol biopolymer transport system component